MEPYDLENAILVSLNFVQFSLVSPWSTWQFGHLFSDDQCKFCKKQKT